MTANWFIALPARSTELAFRATLAPPKVRPFIESDLHMTVAFLGAVEERAARHAFELADEWPTRALDVQFDSVELLGDPRAPSAVAACIGAREANSLRAAMELIRPRMLRAASAPPEERLPLPHVTFARIARNAGPADRRVAVDWARSIDVRGVACRLDSIALYTWAEDRRLRLFRVVESRTLG